MNDFLKAYVICALWSSNDESDSSGGEPLDQNYSISDIARETLKQMEKDCEDFQTNNKELLEQSGLSVDQQGHDFWLTRNRHGAGFWDRGIGEIGTKLTENTRPYGTVDLYVGDDGKIYC